MKRKENTRLGHVITQVVFHMGEKLPKWLQQGEITVPEKKINLNEIVKKQ